MRLPSRCQWGCRHLEGLPGLEDLLPEGLIHKAVELVLTVGRKPTFLVMWTL